MMGLNPMLANMAGMGGGMLPYGAMGQFMSQTDLSQAGFQLPTPQVSWYIKFYFYFIQLFKYTTLISFSRLISSFTWKVVHVRNVLSKSSPKAAVPSTGAPRIQVPKPVTGAEGANLFIYNVPESFTGRFVMSIIKIKHNQLTNALSIYRCRHDVLLPAIWDCDQR